MSYIDYDIHRTLRIELITYNIN
uniref:Uncharacterized protein n=1 Tax=Arundo donax TaxID=35708 RepID=A0A0A9B558_ARUDO